MLDGLNKNRAVVQRTIPSRLEVAFSNVLARFTSPRFAQIFKRPKTTSRFSKELSSKSGICVSCLFDGLNLGN